jgi:tRNA threonylcarbamoyl adenosine modification protein (Sua5/YciO/YrdC/YwlC family)
MTPRTIDLAAHAGDWRAEAVETLARGGLVALPTETVYGLAARADDDAALDRLAALKGRPSDRAFTWHTASPDALERFPAAGAAARRLARRYWPGPLTLVLPGVPEGLERLARDGWTGVRCVAGEAAAALCAAAPFPLAMTSANPHGAEPAVEAADLAGLPLAADDLVLDGGRALLGESSTVLRVGEGRFELLREGLHDLDALRRAAGLRLAFVCTGNTCRSPMVEALARAAIAARLGCAPDRIGDFGMEVRSMGIHAPVGSPPSPHGVEVLAARGIDLSGHRASQATIDALLEQDAVYGLTRGHVAALRQALPPSRADRVHLLDPDGRDIADPIGGDLETYAACAAEIEAAIEARLDEWA